MDKYVPFQIPSYISGIKKMSRSWRLTIDTQENISGDQLKHLNDLSDKLGWMSFNVHMIEAENIIDLPQLRKLENEDKSPSVRLRAVFFRLWEQDNHGFKTADEHYKFMMEKIIVFYKEKLS